MSQPENGQPMGLIEATQDPSQPQDPTPTLPAVVIVRLPDGQVKPVLQGIDLYAAPTIVELGLKALRKDLGLG